nr:spore germination protein [Paenibacillus hamazuiensis]
MRHWEDRSVTETTAQSVVRGPKEAFTENLRTNTALLRRRIKDPQLWSESKSLGKYTKTAVVIMYIHGLANDKNRRGSPLASSVSRHTSRYGPALE